MMRLFLTFLLFSLAHCSQLTPFQVTPQHKSIYTSDEIGQLIVDAQPELIRKALMHYMEHMIDQLEQKYRTSRVKDQISTMFLEQNMATTSASVYKFVRQKLAARFQVQKFSRSFQQEIEANPQAYFLNYEMYDLLVEE